MKTLKCYALSFFVFVCFVSTAIAQEEWNGDGLKFSFETLLRNQIVLPPSPEAASLGKYGNMPVSHFTGAPQVQVPIYTLGAVTCPGLRP